MAINFILPLRIAQAIFALITLALTAFVASWYLTRAGVHSPSQDNFLLFTAIWTLLVTPYLALSPIYFPRFAHKFVIVALEALTMIFWFAGFIALAAFLGRLGLCLGHVCRSAQAAAVFGAFEWLLFLATSILAALHVWRTRNTSSTKAAPNMEMSATV